MENIIKLRSRGGINNYLKKMKKLNGEESKTYVFGNDGSAAMSAALANSNLAPLMAAMNNNGFGGEGAWWIVIILAVLFGSGGWGGNGNQNTNAVLSALNGNTGRDMIMQAVNGNQTAIS